jgi:uncharacterized protein
MQDHDDSKGSWFFDRNLNSLLFWRAQVIAPFFNMIDIDSIPPRAGIGLKNEHIRAILEAKPGLAFLEIHAENYMGDGGPLLRYLEAIREIYPLSLHGVGLSIGGHRSLDREHLKRLRGLNERYSPGLFSEHLAWSSHDTGFLADLLPLPYSIATFERVRDHINETQEYMGRQMLLENPASYLSFEDSTMGEAEFISRLVEATGCGLLLDVNNVFVSARNLKTSAQDYLNAYPLAHVQEIHLAGHDVSTDENAEPVLIDDHASPVSDDVWALYADVIKRTGLLPTLIERDNNVPPLKELVAEADYANSLAQIHRKAA